MESRKNSRANLENKKGIFLLMGLLFILSVTFAAFNVKTYTKSKYEFEMIVDEQLLELPPVILPPPPPTPPLPEVTPVSQTLDIEIVDNNIEIDEPDFVDQPPEELDTEDFPPSVPEPLSKNPPLYVSNMPYFGNCGKIKSNFKKVNAL